MVGQPAWGMRRRRSSGSVETNVGAGNLPVARMTLPTLQNE